MIIITTQQLTVVCTDALHNIFITSPPNNVKKLSKTALIINILTKIQVNACHVHKDTGIIKPIIFVRWRHLHVHLDSILTTRLVFVGIANLAKIITMSLKFVNLSIQTVQEVCISTIILANADIVLQDMFMTTLFSSAEWAVRMIKCLITRENNVCWFPPLVRNINITILHKENVSTNQFALQSKDMTNIVTDVLIFLLLHQKVQRIWFILTSSHMKLIMIREKLLINIWETVLIIHRFIPHPAEYVYIVLKLTLISILKLKNVLTVESTDMTQAWEDA